MKDFINITYHDLPLVVYGEVSKKIPATREQPRVPARFELDSILTEDVDITHILKEQVVEEIEELVAKKLDNE